MLQILIIKNKCINFKDNLHLCTLDLFGITKHQVSLKTVKTTQLIKEMLHN